MADPENIIFSALNLDDSTINDIARLFFTSFYNNPDSIFIAHWLDEKGKGGKIVEANEKTLRTLGYTKPKLLKLKITDIIDKEDEKCKNLDRLKPGKIFLCQRTYNSYHKEKIIADSLNVCARVNEKRLIISVSRDISIQVSARQNIIKSEQNYRQLAKNLPETDVYLLDTELRFILSEGKELEKIKIHDGILEGEKLQDKMEKEVVKLLRPIVKDTLKGKNNNTEEQIANNWFRIRSMPLRDENNKIFAALIMIHNTTPEKIANQRLRMLSAIIDNTNDTASIKDLNLRFIAANNSLIKLSGKKSQEDFIGKTDLEVFGNHEHVREYMANELEAQKLKPGDAVIREEKFYTKSGKVLFTYVKKFPVFNENNKLIGTANISTDITDLKSTREKLVDSEKQYKTLVENQGEGLVMINNEEFFTYANQQSEEIFGTNKGGLINKSMTDFLDLDNLQIYLQETKKRSEEEKFSYELEITDEKGNKKTILVTETQQTDATGKLIGTFAIFRDISSRKETENALKKSESELKKNNIAKDKFFSIIAHDLKNPFNSIAGFARLLMDNYDQYDKETVRKYLKQIIYSSTMSHNLVQNLLNWSRSQTGRLSFQPEEHNMYKIAKGAIDQLKTQATEKNISITNNIDPSLILSVDKNSISEVFRNLVSNAIKYTPSGGSVKLDSDILKTMVMFSVEDTGVGIESEDIQKLFSLESNYRRKGTANEEGSGLGLILCKEFIGNHDGKIYVESMPGTGSKFSFSLPINTPESFM